MAEADVGHFRRPSAGGSTWSADGRHTAVNNARVARSASSRTGSAGSSRKPRGARRRSSPPPPDRVAELMVDLCAFLQSRTSLPSGGRRRRSRTRSSRPIHPFADGNGRTGRALVHVLLKRRGLAPVVVPPVSPVLATRSEDYIAGLTSTRSHADPYAPEAVDGLNRWIALFAAAMTRAVADGDDYERQVRENPGDVARGGREVRVGRGRAAFDRRVARRAAGHRAEAPPR